MSTIETDEKIALRTYVDGLGLTYTPTFQPTPQPRETVEHPQLHWRIHLAKGKQVMTVDYHEGCGHVHAYDKMKTATPYDRRIKNEAIRKTCETGNIYTHWEATDSWMRKEHSQPAPKLLDVLYCLVQDADVLNYSTYEQWASELGYDEDSRKGEKTYRLCLEQSVALKNLIGFAAMEQLQTLYQDY